MQQDAGLIVTFGVVLAFSRIAISAEPAVGPPVVGHEFKGISVPGISAVFWTRREDHFTLQFQFCTLPGKNPRLESPGLARVCTSTRAPDSPYPDVRVQLRDDKGEQIPHLRRFAVGSMKPESVVRGVPDGVARAEVVYTYHLADGDRAATVRLQIDGREFVEKVPRFD